MKNKSVIFFAIVLVLICSGCNEKTQKYFQGSVLEITDNYLSVIPDNSESIKKMGDIIQVPKEVVSKDGVPELSVRDRIRVVYNEAEQTEDGIVIDIVYAIYREDEIE